MQDQEKPHLSDTEDQQEFGLPETHYEPVDREEDDVPTFEAPTYYDDEEEKKPSYTGWIVGSIVGLLVIGVVTYLFFFNGMDQVSTWFGQQEPEPVAAPESAFDPTPSAPVYEEPVPESEKEPVAEAPVNPLAPYQEISTITAPTGLSYIVIGSFVDADMANDMAEKMLKQGVGVKIILPTQRSPLQHRVVVAEFGNFREAMQQIESFRSEYGDKAWVLKY